MSIRIAFLLIGLVFVALAMFWPRLGVDVTLSRGAATALVWTPEWREPAAGVYLRDGEPRYVLRGVDVTAEEFRRTRTAQEWAQAQAWIREQQAAAR